MKVKELIRKLKEFDENLEVTVTTTSTPKLYDIELYNKDIEMYRGDLEVLPTPIVDIVKCLKNNKGKYLVLDVTESGFYTYADFTPR